jgi:hypothetical protein
MLPAFQKGPSMRPCVLFEMTGNPLTLEKAKHLHDGRKSGALKPIATAIRAAP